jgi:hypothetical protein
MDLATILAFTKQYGLPLVILVLIINRKLMRAGGY